MTTRRDMGRRLAVDRGVSLFVYFFSTLLSSPLGVSWRYMAFHGVSWRFMVRRGAGGRFAARLRAVFLRLAFLLPVRSHASPPGSHLSSGGPVDQMTHDRRMPSRRPCHRRPEWRRKPLHPPGKGRTPPDAQRGAKFFPALTPRPKHDDYMSRVCSGGMTKRRGSGWTSSQSFGALGALAPSRGGMGLRRNSGTWNLSCLRARSFCRC